jgi:hypothetical protein
MITTRSNFPSLLRGTTKGEIQPTKLLKGMRENERLKEQRHGSNVFVEPAEFGPNNAKLTRLPSQFDEDKITRGEWVEEAMGRPDAYKRSTRNKRIEDFYKD